MLIDHDDNCMNSEFNTTSTQLSYRADKGMSVSPAHKKDHFGEKPLSLVDTTGAEAIGASISSVAVQKHATHGSSGVRISHTGAEKTQVGDQGERFLKWDSTQSVNLGKAQAETDCIHEWH